MKVLGLIREIYPSYQQEKEKNDRKYWGEKYNIVFEAGDDTHLIETDFIHCQGKDGGRVILKHRGIYEGAPGMMQMSYTLDTWNGRTFRKCSLVSFKNMDQQQTTTVEQTIEQVGTQEAPASAPAPTVEQVINQVKQDAEKARKEGTDLPF